MCHMGLPIDGIERVTHCKLLRVIAQDTFSAADMHVNYILSICSQRIFLMKRLRDQGLPVKHLNTVFEALYTARSFSFYTLPSWGCFLTAELSGKIGAFLRTAPILGSTVGYPSDSLTSCYVYWRRHALHAIYIALSDYRLTSIRQWLLDYETGEKTLKHWYCVAHFRYRGSIEYRDTWDGIVIVAPISGIAQHYITPQVSALRDLRMRRTLHHGNVLPRQPLAPKIIY